MAFYKTQNPDVLAVFNQFELDKTALATQAEAFADLFRTENQKVRPIYKHDLTNFEFHGLVFSPILTGRLWSKPHRNGGHQWPLSKVTKLTDEEKILKNDLNEKYKTRPNHRVCKDKIYEAIGTNWGNLMFTGIAFFLHNDCLYVKTSAKLAEVMQEILTSEYLAAKDEFNKLKAKP